MAVAHIIPIDGRSLVDIQDHLECLFESLEGLEDESLRAECEEDIYRFIEAEVRKVDNISGYLAHCEAQQDFASAEMKRLQDRKRSWERKQERLEQYIQRVMEASGKSKLEGRTSTLSLKACPASVEVLDQKLVPQQYVRVTVTEAVDKTAAKVALKLGEQIPGLKLVTDKRTVTRK